MPLEVEPLPPKTGQQWILVITGERLTIERADESSGRFDEESACGNIPFILGGEGKSDIGASGGNEAKFVGDRTGGLHGRCRILKLCPLAAFKFASAGENDGAVEAWSGGREPACRCR